MNEIQPCSLDYPWSGFKKTINSNQINNQIWIKSQPKSRISISCIQSVRTHFLLLGWCEKVNSHLIFFQTCNIFVDVMAGVYTEETLQPLNKTQIIKLFLKTQEQTNNTINTLTEEIKEIHHSFKILESEIVVVKKLNDALAKQLSSVQRQCWKKAQYSRRECVEMWAYLLQLNMIN